MKYENIAQVKAVLPDVMVRIGLASYRCKSTGRLNTTATLFPIEDNAPFPNGFEVSWEAVLRVSNNPQLQITI